MSISPTPEPSQTFAARLAEEFGVNEARIASIIERLTTLVPAAIPNWWDGEVVGQDMRRMARISVLLALQDTSYREEALRLLEGPECAPTLRRQYVWNHLHRSSTPTYSRAELYMHLLAYWSFRRCNRDLLVQTGYPNLGFGPSAWLDSHFYPLIPRKIPVSAYHAGLPPLFGLFGGRPLFDNTHPDGDDLRPRDADGHLVHRYTWFRKTEATDAAYQSKTVATGDTQLYDQCDYAASNVLTCYPAELAGLLDAFRPNYFDAYQKVVQVCQDALGRGTTSEPISRLAYRRLEETLGRKHVRLLDAALVWTIVPPDYLSSLFGFLYPQASRYVIPGPLALAAHCEGELTIGAYDHVVNTLGTFLSAESPQPTYFSLLGGPTQRVLDSALDRFDTEYAQQQYQVGILYEQLVDLMLNGDPDLKPVRAGTIWVPSAMQEECEIVWKNLPGVAAANRLSAHVTLAADTARIEATVAQLSTAKPANFFRRNGRDFECCFNGVQFRVRHCAGLVEISWLLAHPNEEAGYGELLAIEQAESCTDGPVSTLLSDESDFDEDFQLPTSDRSLDPKAQANLRREILASNLGLEDARRSGCPKQIGEAQARKKSVEAVGRMSLTLRGRPIDLNSKALLRLANTMKTRIRRAIKTVHAENTDLGNHLKSSIHYFYGSCRYDPPHGTDWDTSIER